MKVKACLIFFFLCLVAIENYYSQNAVLLRDGVSLSIGSGTTLNIQGNVSAEDGGAPATISTEGDIELSGNWANNGTGNLFTESNGSVRFVGSTVQNIQGSTHFNNVEIDNGNGVMINSGVNGITNTLTLTNGTLTTNDSLTLIATAIGTGRIAPITSGSISGDVIIQAFMETTDYDYKYLSMPVQGGTLDEWSDDFVMTGFTGSQFPSFSFNSIFYYRETNIGARNTRYENATNITNVVAMGEGVQAYTGGTAFVLDAKGEIYSGNLSLPVTFTDDPGQPDDEDGWNLVGNPYPSTIDWDAGSPNIVRTNIDDAIYIYESSTGNYQSYVNGAGTNGGSRYIPSSQAFFVKASGASPSLQLQEGAKVAEQTSFIERQSSPELLRLKLMNNRSGDEIVIRYNRQATSHFDASWDALKVKGIAQNIALTARHNQIDYSILSLPEDSMNQDIFLQVNVPVDSIYELHVTQLPSNAHCLIIEDLFTGRLENLRDSLIFHFQISDSTIVPQFRLSGSKVAEYKIEDPKCFNDSALLTVHNKVSENVLIRENILGNTTVIDSLGLLKDFKLPDGIYHFEAENKACLIQRDTFVVQSPSKLDNQLFSEYDSLNALWKVWIEVTGGIEPYTYLWNDVQQQTTDTAFALTSGWYSVLINDSNQCKDSASIHLKQLTVGLDHTDQYPVKIYPNPVTDYLRILLEEEDVLFYELFDPVGKLLMQGRCSKNSRLDLQQLKNGFYFLNLNGKKGNKTIKIQKIE